MKTIGNSFLRTFLYILSAVLTACCLLPTAFSQQPAESRPVPGSGQFPAAKAQKSETTSPVNTSAEPRKENAGQEKDSPDIVRKRDEWFYKQRSSANGHIPAGARQQALQHMQRRMEAEGRLVHLPNGATKEVIPFGAVTNPWTSIGPTPTTGGTFSPVTGRITTIAIDPSDATGNTVLIGGAQGGIWRTTDAGTTWTAVGDQNSSLAMGSIAFAPSSPATVYAGTGEQASVGFDIYYGAGVLKSADSGQTWSPTCTTPSATCPFIGPFSDITPFGFFTLGGARISYISVNPSNAQMVLVAAQFAAEGAVEGVYCTDNGGTTWSQVLSGEMSTFVGFATNTTAFAALGNPFGSTNTNPGNGIFKATGIGSTCPTVTFTRLTAATLPAQSSMGRIDLGISPNFATDNTVYASIADSTTQSDANLGVWATADGGTTWAQKTTAPDVCDAQCWYDNVIKVDPNNKNIVFLGGSSAQDPTTGAPTWVVRTSDGGTTWSTVIPNALGPGLPHVDNHAIAMVKLAAGVRLYLGNDGGIWRTDNAEATPVVWTNLNDSALTLTQFYPAISIHPSSPLFAFAGAQDNGSQIYAGPSTTWTDNNQCGDGTGTAIDDAIPSTVYVTCNGLNIVVSVTGGQANSVFLPAVNGINPADNADFVPPLVTDPNTANTVYAGTTKVYQSVNTGNSWTALSSDLVNGAAPALDELTALVVATGNSSVVYAGADTGQVFVATNVAAGTGSFAPVAGQSSLPPRQINSIATDPADATGKTAYAAFSGFAFTGTTITDTKGHLFKTADGGATWTDVSCSVANCATPAASDLPNTPVNDIVVDPDIAGTLYAGTDIGVYQGTCTGTPTTCTWSVLSSGLPHVAVLSLKLHRASRTLRAATHGRGAWDIVLNNFTFTGPHITSISPVSAVAGGAGFTLTVNGVGLTSGNVMWNGSATGVTQGGGTDTQLTATIAASLIGGGGVPAITVQVGATASNALAFTVLGGAPTITMSSPANANVNAASAMLTVTGTGFSSSSVVLLDPDVGGTAIPTTFVSATQLTATVPATFLANFGSTNSVGVQNPPPGGGTTVTTSTVTLPTFVVAAPAPANDNVANAINITSTTFTDTKDSSGATAQTSDPVPACSQSAQIPFNTGTSNTIWYQVTPSGSGTANIDTIGSSYDSVLSVWTGTPGSFVAVTNGCNDDINPGIVVQSQLTGLPLNAGTTYFIMVSSFGPADPNPIALGGKSVLNFSFSGTIGSATGNFTVASTPLTLSSSTGAAAGATITVTPTGGFTGNVVVTASTLPPGVTCPSSPLTINVTGTAAVTGTFNCQVTASSSSLTATVIQQNDMLEAKALPLATGSKAGAKGWWTLSAGTGFAAILLLLLPGGRKRLHAALGLGLVCLLSLALGCGGGYGGGGGGGGGGTTATTTSTTVNADREPSGTAFTFSVTVTGGSPAGMAQLFDGGTPISTAGASAAVSGGKATLTTSSLAVGTHAISVHYLGDAYTQASQSGSLNLTVTGSTTVAITTSPVATPAAPAINVTIN